MSLVRSKWLLVVALSLVIVALLGLQLLSSSSHMARMSVPGLHSIQGAEVARMSVPGLHNIQGIEIARMSVPGLHNVSSLA